MFALLIPHQFAQFQHEQMNRWRFFLYEKQTSRLPKVNTLFYTGFLHLPKSSKNDFGFCTGFCQKKKAP